MPIFQFRDVATVPTDWEIIMAPNAVENDFESNQI